MEPVITVWEEADVPALWRDMVASWFEREFHWPMDRTATPQWRVLCTAGEDLIGHVGLLTRDVTVAGEPVAVAGVGAVILQPAWRGRGLGKAMLQAAHAFMRDRTHADFGLLICEDHRLGLYAGLGWQAVPGPMAYTNWQGQRETVGRHHVMVLPLRAGMVWPEGAIDQRGLPW